MLIHSAAGGIGHAAISIAKHIGAEIYATAGSEEKRQLVRDMGVARVYNSRSTEWFEVCAFCGVCLVDGGVLMGGVSFGVSCLRLGLRRLPKQKQPNKHTTGADARHGQQGRERRA